MTYKMKTDHNIWSHNTLDQIESLINQKVLTLPSPIVIVLEIGHFKLPVQKENFAWASQNFSFTEALCKKIIKKYKHRIKVIPTLLINNLDSIEKKDTHHTLLADLLKNNKYITLNSLKILSEKNLKNRAYKALKNHETLSSSFTNIDGKAYLKDEEYQHDLAAGFMDDDGTIIPRCGLILTSFLDKVSAFALQRMHQSSDIQVLFVSFSQEYFEYERVKLGVDIYTSNHACITLSPIVVHWEYKKEKCVISHRNSSDKKWTTLSF